MIVTVMYRNGLTHYPVTIEINDHCPKCGRKRGKPYPYRFCEDGEWFTVDKWDNPCGHIDYYKDVIKEAQRIKNEKKR